MSVAHIGLCFNHECAVALCWIRHTLCVEIFTSQVKCQKFHCTKIFVIFFIVRGLTEILYIKNVHFIMRLIIIMQILEADTDEGVKECFSDEEQCLLLATGFRKPSKTYTDG